MMCNKVMYQAYIDVPQHSIWQTTDSEVCQWQPPAGDLPSHQDTSRLSVKCYTYPNTFVYVEIENWVAK